MASGWLSQRLRAECQDRLREITDAISARRARSTTFDAFSHRLCSSLIAALDLTIDQADGSRPMTVDELRHYTGHRP